MICQEARERLDAFSDGMLPDEDSAAVREHLHGCLSCAGEALGRERLRRSLAQAGQRYTAPASLRAKLTGTEKRPSRGWIYAFAAAAAAAGFIFVFSLVLDQMHRQQAFGHEIADLHVTTLASAAPVDIVSTDRHTVKPWFQGKVPFTFNPPEVAGTPFKLIGGRVVYVHGAPGALLLYQVRQHHISVIVTSTGSAPLETPDSVSGFRLVNWRQDDLDFYAVTDASAEDLVGLRDLFLRTH